MARRRPALRSTAALYDRVAAHELARLEVTASYHAAALAAAGDRRGDPPPAGVELARPEDLEPALEQARAELEAFERAVAARRPVLVAGRVLTACLAELGLEPFERYGERERRPGRWRVHPDGRYEPVVETAEVIR